MSFIVTARKYLELFNVNVSDLITMKRPSWEFPQIRSDPLEVIKPGEKIAPVILARDKAMEILDAVTID